jgi:hypothetical protein
MGQRIRPSVAGKPAPEHQLSDQTQGLRKGEGAGSNLADRVGPITIPGDAPRTLVIPAGIFNDATLGLCGLTNGVYPFLRCHKPFQQPAYIARFDAPNSSCKAVQSLPHGTPTNLDVAYAWQPPRDELSFSLAPRITDGTGGRPVEYSFATLCPGAEIRLARPVFKRRFRVQLEIPAVRLQDLAERVPS